jgi:hypothetical protein
LAENFSVTWKASWIALLALSIQKPSWVQRVLKPGEDLPLGIKTG